MIKAVIFDMDGVLIDSQPIHYEADRLTLNDLGVVVDHAFLSAYAGTSNYDRFSEYKIRFNLAPSVEALIQKQIEIIYQLLEKEAIEPIQGIKALLERLSASYKIAVASSSSYDFIHIILKKLSIANYFDCIVSGEEMTHGKPAPDIFLATADKLGLLPIECVVIEDSMNGVLAARSANMKCIGYRNPSSLGQDITSANIVLDDYDIIDLNFINSL